MSTRTRAPGRKDASAPSATARTWLLLTHHVPPEPAYLRIKVRRRLRRLGAVPLKNSVYVLPTGEETREDFEWLCREIEREGGEATLCLATFLDEATDARIVDTFRRARAADYRAIQLAARERITRHEEERMKGATGLTPAHTEKLKRSLAAAGDLDFFDAPGRREAERAIADLEARTARSDTRPGGATGPGARPAGRTWVTRTGVKVDRMASAWLIARFIDPGARFKFVPAQGYSPLAGELRFDMFGGEFTHRGDRCTFETLIEHFALADPALEAVAEVVHDVDCKDDKFGRAEAAGIASVVNGIAQATTDDDERLRRGAEVFAGLYEHFRSA